MILTVTLNMAGGPLNVSTDIDAADLSKGDCEFATIFIVPALSSILRDARSRRRIPEPECKRPSLAELAGYRQPEGSRF